MFEEQELVAMYEELTKLAAPNLAAVRSALSRAAGPGGAGMGLGGMLGAGGGAVLGGVRGAREAKEQGGSAGAGALAGALRGAGKGALVGAATGGLAGSAAGVAGAKGLGEKLTSAPGALGSAARFGQRQVHGVTGWSPEAGIRSIRGGAHDALERKAKATKGLLTERGLGVPGGGSVKATKELSRATAAADAAVKAEDMGLTNIPGYLRSLKNNGVAKTVRAGFDSQLKGTSPMNKALMVGMPAASVGSELLRKDEAGAPGKFEPAARAATGLLYAAAPLPIAGQLLAGGALGAVGSRTGRAIDKMRNKKNTPAPATLESSGGLEAPVEHVYTDRAMGRAPEMPQ